MFILNIDTENMLFEDVLQRNYTILQLTVRKHKTDSRLSFQLTQKHESIINAVHKNCHNNREAYPLSVGAALSAGL